MMGRRATGHLCENRSRVTGEVTSWGVRFRYGGRRWYLTLAAKTRHEAVSEVAVMMAEVRRGVWAPPLDRRPGFRRRVVPVFEEFAEDWFVRQKLEGGRRGTGLSDDGCADLQWRLGHLLEHFASGRVDAITILDVDRYRLAKVREGKLNATSINKTLTTLAAVLETAVEYELIDRNPAKGRRRRLPAVKPARSWLDRADHIEALLDAAGEIDRRARGCAGQRRALLATLMFAGLRLGEALALRWEDVDLARGVLRVRHAKTDAGVRIVNLLPVLRDELLEYRVSVGDRAEGIVFATCNGRALGASNVRLRILRPAVELASAGLRTRGLEPLPDGLTPHSLRRTFASLLFALGEAPPYVMRQVGHTTALLTLELYAREMHRRDGEPARLRALIEGVPVRGAPRTATIASTSTTFNVTAAGARTAVRILHEVPNLLPQDHAPHGGVLTV
jgi:integrase